MCARPQTRAATADLRDDNEVIGQCIPAERPQMRRRKVAPAATSASRTVRAPRGLVPGLAAVGALLLLLLALAAFPVDLSWLVRTR